jgi:hypothetical protein
VTLGTLPSLLRSTSRKKQDVLCGFMRRVAVSDLLVISWAVLGAQQIRFGSHNPTVSSPAMTEAFPDLRYTELRTRGEIT